jgi:hypothetical protein
LAVIAELGQPPVDDQGPATLADDDVARLDVAVQHAPAVRVLDRIANVDVSPQQLAKRAGLQERTESSSIDSRRLRDRARFGNFAMAWPGLNTQQSVDECVNILVCVIERQRRPDGRLQAEAAQDRLGAVVASA